MPPYIDKRGSDIVYPCFHNSFKTLNQSLYRRELSGSIASLVNPFTRQMRCAFHLLSLVIIWSQFCLRSQQFCSLPVFCLAIKETEKRLSGEIDGSFWSTGESRIKHSITHQSRFSIYYHILYPPLPLCSQVVIEALSPLRSPRPSTYSNKPSNTTEGVITLVSR